MKRKTFLILFRTLITIGLVSLVGTAVGAVWIPFHTPASHVLGEIVFTACISLGVGMVGMLATELVDW